MMLTVKLSRVGLTDAQRARFTTGLDLIIIILGSARQFILSTRPGGARFVPEFDSALEKRA